MFEVDEETRPETGLIFTDARRDPNTSLLPEKMAFERFWKDFRLDRNAKKPSILEPLPLWHRCHFLAMFSPQISRSAFERMSDVLRAFAPRPMGFEVKKLRKRV
ncbi:hypothetical protein KM043_009273 [Ampulex compressa]|nr:hypothetical protein KM043_009273 [Ampulex compressa]